MIALSVVCNMLELLEVKRSQRHLLAAIKNNWLEAQWQISSQIRWHISWQAWHIWHILLIIFSNSFRTSSAQSSTNSSKRRIILDWARSWKRYKKRQYNSSSSQKSDECQCKRCITRAMNNPEKALNSVSQIDKISRIVFPMAFSLLNGFYWFSYLKHSQRIDLSFESAWKINKPWALKVSFITQFTIPIKKKKWVLQSGPRIYGQF